jgi:hypothetical protein
VTSTTWIGIVAAAVLIVPPWSPPAVLVIATALLWAVIGVRAINGIV